MASSATTERVLVIIPAYNEQGAIRQVVHAVRGSVPYADVLVIDDGSSDETAWNAHQAGAVVVCHPYNLGIGATVQTGLRFARDQNYDLVVRVDGDGQHNHAEIPMLCDALRDARVDAVFGSRFLGTQSDMQIPVLRKFGIICFATLVTLLTGHRATDTTSGFCCLNRRAIEVLASYMPQDYPEVEGRVVMHKADVRVLEVPTRMFARRSGVSSIDSWRSLYYALKVSVAVLIAAIKDIPTQPKEPSYVNSLSAASIGRLLQPALVSSDRATDPQAKAS